MSSNADSLQRVVELLARALRPLAGQTDEASARRLLAALGWEDVPSVPTALASLQTHAAAVLDKVGALKEAEFHATWGHGDPSGVGRAAAELAFETLGVVKWFRGLRQSCLDELDQGYRNATGIAEHLERRLWDYLFVSALSETSTLAVAVLTLLGVVSSDRQNADDSKHQPEFDLIEVRWASLRTLVTSPGTAFSDAYGWGGPQLIWSRLSSALQLLGAALFMPIRRQWPSSELLEAFAPGAADAGVDDIRCGVSLGLLGDGPASVELTLIPLPRTAVSSPQALGVAIEGTADISEPFELAQGLTLRVLGDIDLSAVVGVVVTPGAGVVVIGGSGAGGDGQQFGVSLCQEYEAGAPARVLTIPGGGNVAIGKATFSVYVSDVSGEAELVVEANLERARLQIRREDADGLTKQLMTKDAADIEFDCKVGWSSRRGFYVGGSAGLAFAVPVRATVGPLAIETVRAALKASSSGLSLNTTLDVALALGPVKVGVGGLGLRVDLGLSDGNLGPFGLTCGPTLPDAISLAVSASGVAEGGGALKYDSDNGRYSGALSVTLCGGIAVGAFALIETKVPANTGRTYSFLIALSAEFDPGIQLGYGFVLTGIGGLVGINRTVDADQLLKTVKAGTADHLLFPKNLATEGTKIIREVSALLPAADGHYVVGPMAKLNWASMIDGKLGLFIELPGPRIVLLGVVNAAIPTKQSPTVLLNVDVAGILDFPKKYLAIDASLRDSKLGQYPVSGDMALRMNWGEKPNFVLAVGGLNPTFQAPEGFPKLKRVTVDLGGGKDASVSLCGYFAITSNTVQLGAKAELKASGAGLSLHGWVEFDALFQFSPFSFAATLDAGVKVSFHGYGPTVHLHGELTGPSPYRVQGKVSVSVLWWDASLSFSKTFGSGKAPELPTVGVSEIAGELRAALADKMSWSGVLPPNTYPVVRLASGTDTQKVDPVGFVSVRERALPLEEQLTVYKGVKLSGPMAFSIENARMGTDTGPGTPLGDEGALDDYFAPAQFFAMTDSQKLSAQPFEKMTAGRVFSCGAATRGERSARNIEYVEYPLNMGIGVDDGNGGATVTLPEELMNAALERSPASETGMRGAGLDRYVVPGQTGIAAMDEELYVVADKSTHAANAEITPAATSKASAMAALAIHEQTVPADAGMYVVLAAA